MELLEYLAILRKRWIVVTAFAFATIVAVGGFTLASTPKYEATTRLFFAVPTGESISDLAQGSTFTEKQMSSYAQVATSPLVLSGVVEDLGLEVDPEQLSQAVRAVAPADTVILDITATSTDPGEAAAIANSVGSRLAEVASTLYPPRSDGTQAVRATTLTAAVAPTAPASPNIRRNIVLGVFLGAALGAGTALLLESFDTKIRTARRLEGLTEAAVLAIVAFDAGARSQPVRMVDHPSGPRAEAIRRLRTNLQFVGVSDSPRSILVTSSIADEGKTTTAVNLAVAMSDAGARVLLIDADLRRPSLQRILGIEGTVGLTSVLIGRVKVGDVIQPAVGGRLDVLASGPIPPNPSELLGSAAMASLLNELKSSYDVLLLDSPPVLPVTDAAVLSARVDGTLVVVGADRAHKAQVRATIEALDAVGANILGVVLNKVATRDLSGAYGSQYEYQYTLDAQPAGSSAPRSPMHSVRR